jgi:hypothetical protein
MAQSEKKSVAYYVVITCLVLIAVPSLYAMIWQPSFSEGYISIPFGKGSFIFSLWKFTPAFLALLTFFYMVFRTYKSDFKKRPFILSNILGVAAVGFCVLLLWNFSYTETSFGPSYEDHTFIYFAWPFLLTITLVVLVLCLLFVKRRKIAQQVT